jgi:hypothetical protein
MRATGSSGELRVGYQSAARLGAWHLEVTHTLAGLLFVVVAHVDAADWYWMHQHPLTLTLAFGRFRWEWPQASATIDGERMTIRVNGKPHISREAEVYA